VGSIQTPLPGWHWAALSGLAFGLVAFFSVFIFMFKGRTATFTGLLNRLTSLVAGTTATLLGHWLFKSRFPSLQNWVSLGFVLVAVAFLTRAERRRAQELRAAAEI
jgi:drug/metabolite transporter (DMT)-like permease